MIEELKSKEVKKGKKKKIVLIIFVIVIILVIIGITAFFFVKNYVVTKINEEYGYSEEEISDTVSNISIEDIPEDARPEVCKKLTILPCKLIPHLELNKLCKECKAL